MKKNYQEPKTETLQTGTRYSILVASMEGGEIGGTTDEFDVPEFKWFDDEMKIKRSNPIVW